MLLIPPSFYRPDLNFPKLYSVRSHVYHSTPHASIRYVTLHPFPPRGIPLNLPFPEHMYCPPLPPRGILYYYVHQAFPLQSTLTGSHIKMSTFDYRSLVHVTIRTSRHLFVSPAQSLTNKSTSLELRHRTRYARLTEYTNRVTSSP